MWKEKNVGRNVRFSAVYVSRSKIMFLLRQTRSILISVIPVKFNSIFNSRDFIIDIGILNIIYKFATRKIHHSVNWICLSLSVSLRIFPSFNPSHFSPSPSLPSSPYLPLIYRESYPSFHKTFYTHFGQLVSGRRSYCSIN